VAFPALGGTQTLDQSDTTQDGFQTFGGSAFGAQTFTAGITGKIYRLDLPLAQNAGATSVTVKIETMAGLDPSGTALASTTFSAAGLPGTGLPIPYKTVRFASPADVTAGTQYAIVLSATGGSAAVATDSGGGYAGGMYLDFIVGIGWFGGFGDMSFKEFIGPFPASVSARDPDHVFLCYSKFEHDGGEAIATAQAPLLLTAGRWIPSAVAGNVAGGENHGDFHLDCNPPSAMAPTGAWLGDGGDVVEGQRDGYYPIVS